MKNQEFRFKHLLLTSFGCSSEVQGYIPQSFYHIRPYRLVEKPIVVLELWVRTLSQMEYGVLHGRHNRRHVLPIFKERAKSWTHNF